MSMESSRPVNRDDIVEGFAAHAPSSGKGSHILHNNPQAQSKKTKKARGKKASAKPSRPSAPVVAMSRVTTGALATTPTSRATAVVGMPRTLALRTKPSSPPVRSSAVVVPSRKRSREAVSTEAAAVEVVQAGSAAAEVEVPEPPRKRLHEEEVPPVDGTAADAEVVDEDSRAKVEQLRKFLHMGINHMANAQTFQEFRSCLDTAMALGLLNLAQLDELQICLAEGEEMINRYAKASMRMTEGCSLEQELAVIKEQGQPAMAQRKENDLVIQRENEELAQVEAQIAELQARRKLILERRDRAVAVGTELKSSAEQILKTATEKEKALIEKKLIGARWLADMDNGDIAWRRIICLISGMFIDGI